jgi:hypothetical protein
MMSTAKIYFRALFTEDLFLCQEIFWREMTSVRRVLEKPLRKNRPSNSYCLIAFLMPEPLHDPTDNGSADSTEEKDGNICLSDNCISQAEQKANHQTNERSRPRQRNRADHKSNGEAIDESPQQCRSLIRELRGSMEATERAP